MKAFWEYFVKWRTPQNTYSIHPYIHVKGDKFFSNVFFVLVVLNTPKPLEEEQPWPPPKPAYGTIANGRDDLVMSKCFVYITAHTFIPFHVRLTPV